MALGANVAQELGAVPSTRSCSAPDGSTLIALLRPQDLAAIASRA